MTVSQKVRNVLSFLRSNLERRSDTLRDARRFVRGLEGFSDEERCLLECALGSRDALREFCSAFKA